MCLEGLSDFSDDFQLHYQNIAGFSIEWIDGQMLFYKYKKVIDFTELDSLLKSASALLRAV